jgi:hypothetical protein
MKRLLIVLVVVGAMLFALPATAKKPPTTNPHHPTLEACPADSFSIPIPKTGWVGYECLWTPDKPQETPDAGVEGNVTIASLDGISNLDGISKLLVLVRDDAPLDVCLLAPVSPDQIIDGSFVGSFDLPCGNGTPLHLSVVFFAKKNASPVEVTLGVGPKSQED